MTTQPLAARMRPTTLEEVIGQEHLSTPGSPLWQLATAGTGNSVLLWGPPGSGKTSIASVIARSTQATFVTLSATSATVKDVRTALNAAIKRDGPTVLFLDEIHRFTKTQQDTLLPAVESGTVALIGATTENPHFTVNSALLSRSLLLRTQPLNEQHLIELLHRAMTQDEELSASGITLDDQTAAEIARLASGDVRQALNRLEIVHQAAQAVGADQMTPELLAQVTGTTQLRYDADGDAHYDITSAFIKSMRGTDPHGTLYWLGRMLAGGEDPRFIARRLMIHAAEDVGLADPSVLTTCTSAALAVERVGLPEGRIILAQAALAVACAPKSNGVIAGINDAMAEVEHSGNLPVPMHLRDAHYPGAAGLGHGQGYAYPHDDPRGWVAQQYLPDALADQRFYQPTTHGREGSITQILQAFERMTDDTTP